jgi:hypothetical protein
VQLFSISWPLWAAAVVVVVVVVVVVEDQQRGGQFLVPLNSLQSN